MPLLRRLRHQVAKSPVRTPLAWIRHKSLKSNHKHGLTGSFSGERSEKTVRPECNLGIVFARQTDDADTRLVSPDAPFSSG
jgi:hypothetical protein